MLCILCFFFLLLENKLKNQSWHCARTTTIRRFARPNDAYLSCDSFVGSSKNSPLHLIQYNLCCAVLPAVEIAATSLALNTNPLSKTSKYSTNLFEKRNKNKIYTHWVRWLFECVKVQCMDATVVFRGIKRKKRAFSQCTRLSWSCLQRLLLHMLHMLHTVPSANATYLSGFDVVVSGSRPV